MAIKKGRFQIESADADEISELMSATLAPLTVDAARLCGPAKFDIQAIDLGKVAITMNSVYGGMGAQSDAAFARHSIIFPIDGALEVRLGSDHYAASGFTVATHAVGYAPSFASTNVHYVGIEIAPETLTEVVSAHLGGPAEMPVEFHRHFDLRRPDMEAIRSIVKTLMVSEWDTELLTRSPIATARAADMLTSLAVEFCPNTYSDRLQNSQTRIAPRHVKKAIEYMRENVMNPISMPELANLCGVSLRALQYGFNQFVGMPPLAYMQNLRLAEAWKEIKSESPNTTVAEIAMRWGFANPSRFAALCQKAFGKKPAEVRRLRHHS